MMLKITSKRGLSVSDTNRRNREITGRANRSNSKYAAFIQGITF